MLQHFSSAIFPNLTSGLLHSSSQLSVLVTVLSWLLVMLVVLALSVHFIMALRSVTSRDAREGCRNRES